MKRIVFFLLPVLCLVAGFFLGHIYGEKNIPTQYKLYYQYKGNRPYEYVKSKIRSGNVMYYEGFKYYVDHIPESVFNYFNAAMLMALDHHYSRANYDVYKSILDVHQQFGIDSIDKRTMDLALFFLERGVFENDRMSIAEWKRIHAKGEYEIDSIKANFHKRFTSIHVSQ